MSSWGPVTFNIGNSASQFPMAQFKDVNNPTTIKWTATSSQIGARTLRIRTTEAFAGGRPQITVNSWTSSAPAGKCSSSKSVIVEINCFFYCSCKLHRLLTLGVRVVMAMS